MNKFFRVALQQARRLINNPKKAQEVMDKALKKSNRVQGKKGVIASIKEDILLFFSMLADFFAGKYRNLSLKSGIKILAALIYFVFIIDLVPDFIVGIGLVDDAAILAWVIKSLGGDIDKYKLWRAENNANKAVHAEEE